MGIFAKYWQPGGVKTRLATTIGPDWAAALQYEFLRTLLTRFQTIPQSKALVFTPLERRGEFAQLAGTEWELEPQSDGDLGERMASFLQAAFERRFDRVVLIGSDSPTLPVRLVEESFERLSSVPVVLGPSADGGFYLMGASRIVPSMFTGVEWSTGRVGEQVLANLAAERIPVAQLPPWYDIDERDDLRRLAAELSDDRVGAFFPELSTAVRRALDWESDG
jgi:rSAM/selenodomain-associated transferase 1